MEEYKTLSKETGVATNGLTHRVKADNHYFFGIDPNTKSRSNYKNS
jgi:hypothetical protein